MTRQRLRLVAGWLLAIAGLAFLLNNLLQHVDQLQASGYRPGWRAALAIPCVMAAHLAMGNITFVMLRMLSCRPPWSDVLRIHLVSQVAKYLPMGGVLNVAAQGVGYGGLAHIGMTRSVLAISMMLGVHCSSAAMWASMLVWLAAGKAWWAGALCILALPALLTVYWIPRMWALGFWLLSRISRRIDASQAPAIVNSPRRTATAAALGLVGWAAYGTSLVLVCSEIIPVTPHLAARLVGVMAAGWLVGFASVVAPAGLGVREVTMMILLQPILPAPWPALVPIVVRLLWSVADAAGLAAARLLPHAVLEQDRPAPAPPDVTA